MAGTGSAPDFAPTVYLGGIFVLLFLLLPLWLSSSAIVPSVVSFGAGVQSQSRGFVGTLEFVKYFEIFLLPAFPVLKLHTSRSPLEPMFLIGSCCNHS